MVVVRGSVCSPVSLVFVLYYLDDVADGVGESDIVMITSVVASSSRTWCSSVNKARLTKNINWQCSFTMHVTNHATPRKSGSEIG